MIRILMVCLGNICRSPLAEGLLKSKLDTNKYFVDSAGTGGWHAGQAPDKRSITVAKKYGVDISKQKARQIQLSDFHEFDYIYVMDYSNYLDVIKIAPDESSKSKVVMILNELFTDENTEVPDPYYGFEDGFEKVYQLLNQSCDIIADRLKKSQ